MNVYEEIIENLQKHGNLSPNTQIMIRLIQSLFSSMKISSPSIDSDEKHKQIEQITLLFEDCITIIQASNDNIDPNIIGCFLSNVAEIKPQCQAGGYHLHPPAMHEILSGDKTDEYFSIFLYNDAIVEAEKLYRVYQFVTLLMYEHDVLSNSDSRESEETHIACVNIFKTIIRLIHRHQDKIVPIINQTLDTGSTEIAVATNHLVQLIQKCVNGVLSHSKNSPFSEVKIITNQLVPKSNDLAKCLGFDCLGKTTAVGDTSTAEPDEEKSRTDRIPSEALATHINQNHIKEFNCYNSSSHSNSEENKSPEPNPITSGNTQLDELEQNILTLNALRDDIKKNCIYLEDLIKQIEDEPTKASYQGNLNFISALLSNYREYYDDNISPLLQQAREGVRSQNDHLDTLSHETHQQRESLHSLHHETFRLMRELHKEKSTLLSQLICEPVEHLEGFIETNNSFSPLESDQQNFGIQVYKDYQAALQCMPPSPPPTTLCTLRLIMTNLYLINLSNPSGNMLLTTGNEKVEELKAILQYFSKTIRFFWENREYLDFDIISPMLNTLQTLDHHCESHETHQEIPHLLDIVTHERTKQLTRQLLLGDNHHLKNSKMLFSALLISAACFIFKSSFNSNDFHCYRSATHALDLIKNYRNVFIQELSATPLDNIHRKNFIYSAQNCLLMIYIFAEQFVKMESTQKPTPFSSWIFQLVKKAFDGEELVQLENMIKQFPLSAQDNEIVLKKLKRKEEIIQALKKIDANQCNVCVEGENRHIILSNNVIHLHPETATPNNKNRMFFSRAKKKQNALKESVNSIKHEQKNIKELLAKSHEQKLTITEQHDNAIKNFQKILDNKTKIFADLEKKYLQLSSDLQTFYSNQNGDIQANIQSFQYLSEPLQEMRLQMSTLASKVQSFIDTLTQTAKKKQKKAANKVASFNKKKKTGASSTINEQTTQHSQKKKRKKKKKNSKNTDTNASSSAPIEMASQTFKTQSAEQHRTQVIEPSKTSLLAPQATPSDEETAPGPLSNNLTQEQIPAPPEQTQSSEHISDKHPDEQPQENPPPPRKP